MRTLRLSNVIHVRATMIPTVVYAVVAIFCAVNSGTANAADAVGLRECDQRNFDVSTLKHDEAVRRFTFEYSGKAIGLKPQSYVRVWLPVPATNRHQCVSTVATRFPAEPRRTSEPRYGNRIVYFETKAPKSGEVEFSVTYEVTRAEVKALSKSGEKLDAEDQRAFLKPNRLVPTTGRPLELLRGMTAPTGQMELGRFLYDRVDTHMKYDKSQPGYGNGDSVWACDSRFGNCTDFHSLFISLARAKGLPARFEIGFPIPESRGGGEIGGYHCWASFHTGKHGWVPTDISEADKHPELKDYYFGSLTENRVSFSTGRDLDLVPQQSGPPLNYFVYPYIEVDGQPLSKKNMVKSFRYTDL